MQLRDGIAQFVKKELDNCRKEFTTFVDHAVGQYYRKQSDLLQSKQTSNESLYNAFVSILREEHHIDPSTEPVSIIMQKCSNYHHSNIHNTIVQDALKEWETYNHVLYNADARGRDSCAEIFPGAMDKLIDNLLLHQLFTNRYWRRYETTLGRHRKLFKVLDPRADEFGREIRLRKRARALRQAMEQTKQEWSEVESDSRAYIQECYDESYRCARDKMNDAIFPGKVLSLDELSRKTADAIRDISIDDGVRIVPMPLKEDYQKAIKDAKIALINRIADSDSIQTLAETIHAVRQQVTQWLQQLTIELESKMVVPDIARNYVNANYAAVRISCFKRLSRLVEPWLHLLNKDLFNLSMPGCDATIVANTKSNLSALHDKWQEILALYLNDFADAQRHNEDAMRSVYEWRKMRYKLALKIDVLKQRLSDIDVAIRQIANSALSPTEQKHSWKDEIIEALQKVSYRQDSVATLDHIEKDEATRNAMCSTSAQPYLQELRVTLTKLSSDISLMSNQLSELSKKHAKGVRVRAVPKAISEYHDVTSSDRKLSSAYTTDQLSLWIGKTIHGAARVIYLANQSEPSDPQGRRRMLPGESFNELYHRLKNELTDANTHNRLAPFCWTSMPNLFEMTSQTAMYLHELEQPSLVGVDE